MCRELARLYKDAGQPEKAAECYFKHLQATSSTTLAGSGPAMTDANMSTREGLRHGDDEDPHSESMSIDKSGISEGATSVKSRSRTGSGPRASGAGAFLSLSEEVVDPDRAEGLLFLALYHRNIGRMDKAEEYCARYASLSV
jgi:hypothetical protein